MEADFENTKIDIAHGSATSKQIEKLSLTVQQLTIDLNKLKEATERMNNNILILQAENKSLSFSVNLMDCRDYSQRWSLKFHGIKEENGKI